MFRQVARPRARRAGPAVIATFLLTLFMGRTPDARGRRLRPVAPLSHRRGATARGLPLQVSQIIAASGSPTLDAARLELALGLTGLVGADVPDSTRITANGAVLVGTPAASSLIAALKLDLTGTGREGYVIRSLAVDGRQTTVIAANDDLGVLHGIFHLLRLIQTRASLDSLQIRSAPRLQHRILDHWDNLDGTVERGYAGASIWDWHKLPDYIDPRYER